MAPINLTKIKVNNPARREILALGAELRSSICRLSGNVAYLSEDLGPLDIPENYRKFIAAAEYMQTLDNKQVDLVAHDMHPTYMASRYAKQTHLPTIAIQHHHAHIASCMAEHNLTEKVLAIAADGTGFGPDQAVWGCELLHCDQKDYQRLGHLKYFDLIGSDLASIETWRPALSLAYRALSENQLQSAIEKHFSSVNPAAQKIALTQLKNNSRLHKTSSLGRLFDGIAFLLQICNRNQTPAQAPIALENAAKKINKAQPLEYKLDYNSQGMIEFDYRPMIKYIIENADPNNADLLARQFHETVANMLVSAAVKARDKNGPDKLVISGGCFLNTILTERVIKLAADHKMKVYKHEKIPTSDVCISLGQAVIAANYKP